jgi:lipopolysaccharide assembly outer membrane protein LptD (OstA)
MRPGASAAIAVLLLLVSGALAGAARAGEPAPSAPPAGIARGRPLSMAGHPEFEAQADSFETPEPDHWRLTGQVTFRSGDVLLQADRVEYDAKGRSGLAEGNVLFVQGTSRLAGDSLTFDLAHDTAELTNATGWLEQGFMFRAKRVVQLDRERLRFENGFFTACTQPVPYWSFRVSHGLIIRDRYVHLFNLALKAGPVPVFYSPWLAFPIKGDRATGLLLPQFGTSQRLGNSIGNAFYWAIDRSQDATFYLDSYTRGSLGAGVEHRFLPNPAGAGLFRGYLIGEDGSEGPVRPEQRWNASFREWQNFSVGRLTADLNFVSDKDYFLDYARDPDRGSDPSVLSRLEYVVNRGGASVNLRTERREQFFTDGTVVQSRLPEAEIRMNSHRLGGSPFTFGLEGSAGLLDKSAPDFPSGTWGRFDLFPTLSLPWSPAPFLDLTPTLRVRETYYTRGLDPLDPNDFGDPISRQFVQFDLRLLGPRLSRVFFDSQDRGRMRSTIEPRVTYRYQTSPTSLAEQALVPGFDEIDILPGDLNEFEYGIWTRLFAKRVARVANPIQATQGPGPWAPGSTADVPVPPATLAPGAPGRDVPGTTILSSPVEIASLFVTQRYSLRSDLSFDNQLRDTNGDGTKDTLVNVDSSPFSVVTFGARFNPSPSTSVEGRLNVDDLQHRVSSGSLSAALWDARRGFLTTTYFYRNPLDGESDPSSQVRFSAGSSLWQQKISFAVSLNYDAQLQSLQDQRYRFGYDTQCCGFAFEVLNRNYVGTEDREFRFVINLKGIGNFLDLQSSAAGQ